MQVFIQSFFLPALSVLLQAAALPGKESPNASTMHAIVDAYLFPFFKRNSLSTFAPYFHVLNTAFSTWKYGAKVEREFLLKNGNKYASTMACMVEALGLSLPGNAAACKSTDNAGKKNDCINTCNYKAFTCMIIKIMG